MLKQSNDRERENWNICELKHERSHEKLTSLQCIYHISSVEIIIIIIIIIMFSLSTSFHSL